MRSGSFSLCIFGFFFLTTLVVQCISKHDNLEKIDDIKDFKKLLRTRLNVLVLFVKSGSKVSSSTLKEFDDAASVVRGEATICLIDCSDSSKICKKLKVSPNPLIAQHYQSGDYQKDYDRAHVAKSIVNFLRDPTGDIPWEEDPTAQDVKHITSMNDLVKTLSKSKKPVLTMFYAPWCGHCKRLKPEFAAAASELKATTVLAGINCDSRDLMEARQMFNISGYPTLYYFENGEMKYKYGGEYNKAGIISWLENPSEPKEPEKEVPWSEKESDVIHLSSVNFDEFLASQPSVLVMFYAPWCGHCKAMKPAYEEAAAQLKSEKIEGVLAAVDATISRDLAEKYGVKGFPTIKYFSNGEEKWTYNERTKEKLVEFMKNPVEPPPPPAPEAPWSETESSVVHLTSDDFHSTVKKRKHSLIMFYAPWCGHCKKAKPHFTEAAAKFADNPKALFGAVDCTVHTDICNKYDVSGYPTFKYMNYGKNEQAYNGGREEADFVAFMTDPENPQKAKAAASPAPSEDMWADAEGAENVVKLTAADFDEFISAHASVLVMFYAPWCGHCKRMKPDYAAAATLLKEEKIEGVLAAVDATAHSSVSSKYDVKGFPTLKYFKDGKLAFEFNQRTKDALVSFMRSPSEPKPAAAPAAESMWSGVDGVENVHQLTSKTFDKFLADNPSTLVMFYAPWCGHCKNMKPAFAEAATTAKNDNLLAKFAAVDCTVERDLASRYEVKGFPTLKYFKEGKELMKYSSGRDTQSLLTFMKDQLSKSEEKSKDEL